MFVVVTLGATAAAHALHALLPIGAGYPFVFDAMTFIPASIAAVAAHRMRQGELRLRAWLPFGMTSRLLAATLLLWVGVDLLNQWRAQLSLDPSTWETLSTLSWHEVRQPVDPVEVIYTLALVVMSLIAFEGVFWKTCESAWSRRTTYVAVVSMIFLTSPMATTWAGAIGIVISTALRWVSGSLAGPLLLRLLSVTAIVATQAYPLLTPRVGPLLGMVGVGCLAGGALLAWSARR